MDIEIYRQIYVERDIKTDIYRDLDLEMQKYRDGNRAIQRDGEKDTDNTIQQFAILIKDTVKNIKNKYLIMFINLINGYFSSDVASPRGRSIKCYKIQPVNRL